MWWTWTGEGGFVVVVVGLGVVVGAGGGRQCRSVVGGSSGMNTVTVSVVVVGFFSSFFSFFLVLGLGGKMKENKLVRRPCFLSSGAGSVVAGTLGLTSQSEGFGGGQKSVMWGGGGGGVRVATSVSFSVVCSSFVVTMVTCGFSVFGSSSFTVTIVEMVSSGMKTSEKYLYRKCSYVQYKPSAPYPSQFSSLI